MTDPEQVVDVPDRREAIEAAFEAASTPEPSNEAPVVESTPVVEEGPAEPESPASEPAPEPADEEKPTEVAAEVVPGLDRPPQAWKAPLKAKWDKLDPDIRQEVLRRERETTQVLNDTAQARQLSQAFAQAIQPFAPRLQQLGAHPIQAMSQLLKADQFLSSAPAAARAQYMAKLIKGYGVDIAQLDSALAQSPAQDDVSAKVEQLLQQRLAPFQTFIQQQTEQQKQAAAQKEREAAATIEQMASDPKYPYFDQVRSTMADLIEFSASKGQTLTIEAAYNKAIALDPTVSQQIAARTANQAAQVKRALNASSSVSGNPGGAVKSGSSATDRRATIEAAFNVAGGR